MNKIELATEQLLAIYRKASQELLLKAVEASARNAKGSAAYYRSLWAQVEDKIRTLDMAVGSYSKQVIPLAYSYGVNEAVKGLLHLGIRAKGYDAFQKLHESSIKILVENLNDNLVEANHLMGRRIRDEWRKAQLEAITRKQATGETIQQASKSFTQQIAEKGLGSFRDSMGRVWQIDRYAEMVTRSVTREATNAGLMAQLRALDYDLVQMSSHSSPCPICAPLEGRVYSLSGKTEGYPTIDKAFGEYANVHPNCFIDPQVPVYTSKGWLPIGKINVGDLVLTHKGRFKRVTYLHRNVGSPELVRIRVGGNSNATFRQITITGNHPLLINGQWTDASQVKKGDKITLLAQPCECCGDPAPLYRKTCGKECEIKQVITKRNTSEWRNKLSKSQSINLKKQYKTGVRDRYATTKAANEATRKKVEEGTFVLQKPEVHIKAMRSLGKRNYGKSWIEEKMGWYLKEKLGLDIESQYPLPCAGFDKIGRQRYYFADFALPELKIAIECDGAPWHKDKKRDNKRQKAIEAYGWTVLRFTDDEINTDLAACGEEVARVVNNHTGQYLFVDDKVTFVEIWQAKRNFALFNLAVEEDESYIAQGFVVHNCKHVLLPYVPELDNAVEKTKELSNRPFDIDPRTKNRINAYNAKQTAARWQRATEKQWWQYKQRLGDVPGLKKFAEMKKADSEQYKKLQARYRSAGTYQKQAASAKE